MAFLTDPGVSRPPLSTRLVLPFERVDALLLAGSAALLATIFLVQGPLVSRDRIELSDTAVCQQRTFFSSSLLLLAAH